MVNIIKYNRDKLIERTIKKRKGTNFYTRRHIRENHKASLNIPFQNISVENGNGGEECLKVKDDGGVHEVVRVGDGCGEGEGGCGMRCDECGVCVDEFMCTCSDYLLKTTICKHIHLVKRFKSLVPEQVRSFYLMWKF